MNRPDTREDLPGAVRFQSSLGSQELIWIHPSAVGAVSEDKWDDMVEKDKSVIILRTGHSFFVKGGVKETLQKLGWKEA